MSPAVNPLPAVPPTRGHVAIIKERPQNPKPGTTWNNPLTGLDEIFDGVKWVAKTVSGNLLPANNLSDVVSASTSRTNLGIGSLATQDATSVNFTGKVRLGAQTAQSGNYVMGSTDCTVLMTTGAAGKTVTLPAANSSSQIVCVIKVDGGAGAVTVSRAGADTIEGANSISLAAQYNKCLLMTDGAGIWYRLV